MKKISTLQRSFRIPVLAAALLMPGTLLTTQTVQAAPENYVLDTEHAHAFIQFKINHLGYSWVLGRFDKFTGSYVLDKDNVGASSVKVSIDTASVNTNHAERDKHLRGADFFNSQKFPKAEFVSTKVTKTGDTSADIEGNLTLRGVTKPVTLKASYINGGKDPWGGYRTGFEATTDIKLKDFGIDFDLGPAAASAQVYISVEGIRQ